MNYWYSDGEIHAERVDGRIYSVDIDTAEDTLEQLENAITEYKEHNE